MLSLWKVSFLFICSILSIFGSVICAIYIENGQNLTINPNLKRTPEDILWTFNGNKVAEHYLNGFQVYGQFKERTEIDSSTGRITVHKMTNKDSGVYKSEIQINGNMQYSNHDVQVIDAVPQPDVTCKLNSVSEVSVLFCSVAIHISATYKWTGPNVTQHSGQELHIGKDEQPESVFTCTVQNEVSQKNTSITLHDCITDGSKLKIILAIFFGVMMVVFAVVAIYFIYQRKNKGMKMSAVNKGEDFALLANSDLLGNQSSNIADGHKPAENREQVRSEDGDQSVGNDEEESRNQKMVLGENLKCVTENISILNEDFQDLPKHRHESAKDDDQSSVKEDNEENNEEQERSNNRGEPVDKDKQTEQMNKNTESENCSDDKNIQQELNKTNSQNQFKHIYESAKDDSESSVKENNEENSEEQERSNDRGEPVDKDKQTEQVNKDTKLENCSDDENIQELNKTNFQDQFEQIHESAKEYNQSMLTDADASKNAAAADGQENSEHKCISEHREEVRMADKENRDKDSELLKNVQCSANQDSTQQDLDEKCKGQRSSDSAMFKQSVKDMVNQFEKK